MRTIAAESKEQVVIVIGDYEEHLEFLRSTFKILRSTFNSRPPQWNNNIFHFLRECNIVDKLNVTHMCGKYILREAFFTEIYVNSMMNQNLLMKFVVMKCYLLMKHQIF